MGAALGAYDGYKYAKKKKLKGWKKAAAIAGGAPLGVINRFKVVKAGKAAKATKATKIKVAKNNKALVKTKYKNQKKVSKTLSDSEVEKLAIAATKGPDESKFVVLGRYEKNSASSYDEIAKEIRAQYFHLENYDDLAKEYSKSEIWKINERFIDKQIDSGRTIVLSHDPKKLKIGTFYKEEITYLQRKGYKFSKSGGLWYAHK